MGGYIHQAGINSNGQINISESIVNTSRLRVFASDDGLQLRTPKIGDFEWWYFDLIDTKNDCILKIVAHLGTDPLREKFYPQLALSIKTPSNLQTITKIYSLNDFYAAIDFCDIKFKDEFHVYVKPADENRQYYISIDIDKFKANLNFFGEIEGWKPLGDNVPLKIGNKKATFSWIVPLPKAKVNGKFSFGNKEYQIDQGFGYHDHNYWKVDTRKKLFIDDVIPKWYWGRVIANEYTIVFMNTYFKKDAVSSFLLAKENKIIISSNNLVEVLPQKLKMDEKLKTSFPLSIIIKSIEKDNPFHLILNSKEIIDRRDLLQGINPLIKWLVKLFISKPAYWGILADSTLKINAKKINGIGIYEVMCFRNK